VGVVVAQVLATCTNQASRRALVVIESYACCGAAHNTMLRTWSFVLKQRGLGHEDGEGVRGKAFFYMRHSFSPAQSSESTMSEDQLGPLRSGEDGCVFGGVSQTQTELHYGQVIHI
jgi:hypothetical protein